MIKFIQVLECILERTDSRAHARMDATRNEVTGLLGVDAEGQLWSYNYATKKWNEFPSWAT